MQRDFNKDLTILVTGTGNSSTANIEDNLIEWIFGGNDSRNVKVIIPFVENLGKGMENFIRWGSDFFDWGSPNGDPMIGVIETEYGHKVVSKASKTRRAVDFSDAIVIAMETLSDAGNDGNEIAVISLFEPGSPSDLLAINIAKSYAPIPVHNLCEGMVDFFEGYQSEESILVEGKARENFLMSEAEKDAIDQLDKPVAKKASAPRKRAAKKAAVPASKPMLEEPEKALQDVPKPKHVHRFVWADDGNGHEGSVCYDCQESEPEMPIQDAPVGTVVEVAGTEFTKIGPNPFRAPLPTSKLPEKTDAWTDPDKILVNKRDLADLAEGINLITGAFTRIMGQ